jgi:molecular chaperone GrpE
MSEPNDTKEPTSENTDASEEPPHDDAPDAAEATATEANGQPEEAPSAGDEPNLSETERLRRDVAERLDEDDEAAREALSDLARRAKDSERAQEELDEARNKLMRKAASLQNVRRRAREEQARSTERARAGVLRRMLEVLDDFDRSLDAANQDTEADAALDHESAHESLKEGVEMVREKFLGVLRELDVEPIEAVGQPFDEQLHEAMMRQPAPDDAEPGEVLHEVQKGYRMGERVLRHSRVVVAGPREEQSDEGGENDDA